MTVEWPIATMPTSQARQKPAQTARRGPAGSTALAAITTAPMAMPDT